MTPEELDVMEKQIKAAEQHAGLQSFVAESNRIERIHRRPWPDEIRAHRKLLELPDLRIGDIADFVSAVQPGAVLRDKPGLDVRVGNHIAPAGGEYITLGLTSLLAMTRELHPYELHQKYETLHPFTDGNGRSGRAIWLWMMAQRGESLPMVLDIGFLHVWYYQSLSAAR